MVAGLGIFLCLVFAGHARAEDDAELAKKLQNPVADLISVPLQNNWDFGIGPKDSTNYLLNVQPVIPLSLGEEWNLIVRTIVPFLDTEAPSEGTHDRTGLGDIVQSFFFSPKNPIDGWILGAGPVFLYPSSTDSTLGSDQWGAGPTVVALRQECGWTYGMLANQLWSVADERSGIEKPDVNATFLQPFLSYTTESHTTFTLNSESTYNWEARDWTVPVNLMVAQLVKIGGQPVQFQVGAREYLERPDGGADWGLRAAVTLLFPK
jgi:hypothetical protein